MGYHRKRYWILGYCIVCKRDQTVPEAIGLKYSSEKWRAHTQLQPVSSSGPFGFAHRDIDVSWYVIGHHGRVIWLISSGFLGRLVRCLAGCFRCACMWYPNRYVRRHLYQCHRSADPSGVNVMSLASVFHPDLVVARWQVWLMIEFFILCWTLINIYGIR